MDLYEVSRIMINKALMDDGSSFFQSPAVTKNQAEKLSKDYLVAFNPTTRQINLNVPAEFSSHVVIIPGGQANA